MLAAELIFSQLQRPSVRRKCYVDVALAIFNSCVILAQELEGPRKLEETNGGGPDTCLGAAI